MSDLLNNRELQLLRRAARAYPPVVNASGVVLHTGLGRAPLGSAAAAALAAIAQGWSLLEVDPATGRRKHREARLLDDLTATTGAAHWHALLRARAIENQSYVIAPAQHGQHSANRASYGHSMIIDPWGEVVADLPEGDGYAIAKVDPEHVAQIRQQVPSLANQRPFT